MKPDSFWQASLGHTGFAKTSAAMVGLISRCSPGGLGRNLPCNRHSCDRQHTGPRVCELLHTPPEPNWALQYLASMPPDPLIISEGAKGTYIDMRNKRIRQDNRRQIAALSRACPHAVRRAIADVRLRTELRKTDWLPPIAVLLDGGAPCTMPPGRESAVP